MVRFDFNNIKEIQYVYQLIQFIATIITTKQMTPSLFTNIYISKI